MEVKSSGDAVDIKDFTGKVESGGDLALHALHIDVIEFYTTTGDKFVFVDTFARNRKRASGEFAQQALAVLLTEVRPCAVVWNVRCDAEPLPEPLGEMFKGRPTLHLAFAPIPTCVVQRTCYIDVRQPVDGDGELVI